MSPLLAGIIGFAIGIVVGLGIGLLLGGIELGLLDLLELVE